MILFLNYFVWLLVVKYPYGVHVPPEVCTVYNSSGDITIGGIFSLHDESMNILHVSALQLTEAMVFAVKTINQDGILLPNITLGFRIYDDCSMDEYAMWESMALIMGVHPDLQGSINTSKSCKIPGHNIRNTDTMLAMGVVGTGRTSSSQAAVSTAALFKRPLVSYGATSQELHQENGHEYYFSTISSDDHRAQAVVDVLDHFEWKYLSAVVSSDNLVFYRKFVSLAKRVHGICIRQKLTLNGVPKERKLKQILNKLRQIPSANVVVLITSSVSAANTVLSAISKADPPLNLTWVITNTWETELIQDNIAQGSIIIEYHKPKLVNFEQYFRSLVEGNETADNPWFDEFCEDSDNCQTSSEEGFSKEISTLAPTIDAVFALAYALHKTIRDTCNESLPDCLGERGIGVALVSNLKMVSFPGTRGNFIFEQNSVSGPFTVKNMQQIDSVFKMVEIGYWSNAHSESKRVKLNDSLIQWHKNIDDIPRPACWEECQPGSIVDQDPMTKCCQGCLPCKGDEWPNDNSTVCQKLVASSITWDDPSAAMLVSLSALGLLLCGLASYGMVIYRRHPLIKATSRELSCVNILGIVLALLAVIPFLCRPSAGMCGTAECLYVLSFTLMYAPLLLKVNRIYRIFKSSTKTVKPPRFTGSTAQLVIVAVLVIIQVSCSYLLLSQVINSNK